MILTAGLSPAWQQILVFDEFDVGEVNRACEAHWCASGKVLNVGRAVHALGGKSLTLSVLGGRSGEAISNEFAVDRIPAKWVTSVHSTRVCTTILDRGSGRTTELVENAAPLEAERLNELVAIFEESVSHATAVILTGSIPAGVPTDFWDRLLQIVARRAVPETPTLLDCRGPELLAALPSRPYLVKPNREELQKTFGLPISSDEELLGASQRLLQMGARNVLVTQGKGDVLLVEAERASLFSVPEVETVNPIGCGDCLTAGIAAALSEGLSLTDAVRFGIACGADNARGLLPARLNRTWGVRMSISVRQKAVAGPCDNIP